MFKAYLKKLRVEAGELTHLEFFRNVAVGLHRGVIDEEEFNLLMEPGFDEELYRAVVDRKVQTQN